MDRWLKKAKDDEVYCYLPVERLKPALEDVRVLDALTRELGVPGTPTQLRRLSIEEKRDSIARAVEHQREAPTSIWYEHEPLEILSGAIWHSELQKTVKRQLWQAVAKEEDLLLPTVKFMRQTKGSVFKEVSLGPRRIDLVHAREKRRRLRKVIEFYGIELKNSLREFERALDQLTTFGPYMHWLYLACTPWLAASYLKKHVAARGVKRWDPDAFETKLERIGVGLIIIEYAEGYAYLDAQRSDVEEDKQNEVEAQLTSRRLV